MSWAPVANVLNISTEDIFSVGCDNDPPFINKIYTREDDFSYRDFGV